jgi:hypothetical protein
MVWEALIDFAQEHPTAVRNMLRRLMGDMDSGGGDSKMWVLPLAALVGSL